MAALEDTTVNLRFCLCLLHQYSHVLSSTYESACHVILFIYQSYSQHLQSVRHHHVTGLQITVIRNTDYPKYVSLLLQKQNMSFDMRLLHLNISLHRCICVHAHTCKKAIKTYGEVNIQINTLLMLTLERCEWVASFLNSFTSGKEPSTTHWMQAGWIPELVCLL